MDYQSFVNRCNEVAGEVYGSEQETKFCVYQGRDKKWYWFSEDNKKSKRGFDSYDEATQNASELLGIGIGGCQ